MVWPYFMIWAHFSTKSELIANLVQKGEIQTFFSKNENRCLDPKFSKTVVRKWKPIRTIHSRWPPPCQLFSQKQGGSSGVWDISFRNFQINYICPDDLSNVRCNIFRKIFYLDVYKKSFIIIHREWRYELFDRKHF